MNKAKFMYHDLDLKKNAPTGLVGLRENLARVPLKQRSAQTAAEVVFQAWLSSPGHKANIDIDDALKDVVGIGAIRDTDRPEELLWVTVKFGSIRTGPMGKYDQTADNLDCDQVWINLEGDPRN
jgi:hypothetical protein